MLSTPTRGSFFYPNTPVHLLRHRAEHSPDELAFICLVDGEGDELCLTYAELDEQARAIAAWLSAAGWAGCRALMLYPPGLEFVKAFFGCLYAGVTPVPTNPPRRNHKLSRLEAIVQDAAPAVALTSSALQERTRPLIDASPLLRDMPLQATDSIVTGAEAWTMPDCSPDTLAVLQYTSGSAGAPKGVMLSHANLMHNSALICHAFENTRSSVGVFWLPSYHDMGLIGGIVQPVYVGRVNVFISPMAFLQKPVRWLRAISKYRATTSGGPNFAYDLCARTVTDEQMAGLDLSSWRVAFDGAEPIRAETIDRFTDRFRECGFRRQAFYPCYGMAEATLLVTGGYAARMPVVKSFDRQALTENHAVPAEGQEPSVRRLVGCGASLPDQRVLIVDPERLVELRDGEIGEIWIQGPSVAQGYLNRPDETEEAFGAHLADTGAGPFLRTGDLGFMFERELFVTGRLKELIIVRGRNHHPHDIEATIAASHPQLTADSGAAFVIDEDSRQRLVVVQEVNRRHGCSPAEIFAAIREAVAVQHGLAVDTIVLARKRCVPRTSSGKVQRSACRELVLAGQIREVGRWDAGAPVPEKLGPSSTSSASDDGTRTKTGPSRRQAVPGETPTRRGGPHVGAAPGKSDTGRPSSPPACRGSARAAVEVEIRRIAEGRAGELALDTDIAGLGLDSLQRMQIVAALEDVFGGRFPQTAVAGMYTVGDVIHAVEQYLGGAAQTATPRPDGYAPGPSSCDVARFPEVLRLRQTERALISADAPNPYFAVHQSAPSVVTKVHDRELVNFSSHNYLNMSAEPRVAQAAKRAIDRYGTSVSASRLVSGEIEIHGELERTLAEFIGVDGCLVFVNGHATNVTVIGHLFGPGDLIVYDALAHNSIRQGAELSGARQRLFAHNDWADLDRVLNHSRHEYRRVLVAIEGVYSMDGDFPDLPRFVEVKRKHGALLMVDEAHSLGTMGDTGRGLSEHFRVEPRDVDIWMGTLSKALGNSGGYIAGSGDLIEYLRYTAPGFVFSCGLPPASAAGALEALRVLEGEPDRVERLRDNARLLLELARERGFDTGTSSGTPVVPVITGCSRLALRLSHAMSQRGVDVMPIVHPAVQESAARLRFFVCCEHTREQLRRAMDMLSEAWYER